MESPRTSVEDAVTSTSYFKESLENILKHLHPTFQCLKLIVKILLHGPDGSGKRLVAKMAAKNLNLNFCEERVADLFDENIVGTEKKVRSAITKFATSAPCLIYFTGYELFHLLEDPDMNRIEQSIRESLDVLLQTSSQPIIFIASTSDYDSIYGTPLSTIFHHNIAMISPTFAQAEQIINTMIKMLDIRIDEIPMPSVIPNANYYIGNIIDAVARAQMKFEKKSLGVFDSADEDVKSDHSETTKWLDVGGLDHIKREIIDTIQLSIDYPQLKKSGLRRTGILLHGPPGTGKTLLARAVAGECNLNFINVKGPELLNEYVGQSEDNIRKLFSRARAAAPSVIFFDEIDSLAPYRGQAGDSGGVMDRMVSQLLSELDGVGKKDGIFVIGATNRVDLVDTSLLRPGRFDKILEVVPPSTSESRLQILNAITRKMNLATDVDLALIESMLPSNMSGADFQGLCSRALQVSFDRCIELVESNAKTEDEVEIITTMQDLCEAMKVNLKQEQ